MSVNKQVNFFFYKSFIFVQANKRDCCMNQILSVSFNTFNEYTSTVEWNLKEYTFNRKFIHFTIKFFYEVSRNDLVFLSAILFKKKIWSFFWLQKFLILPIINIVTLSWILNFNYTNLDTIFLQPHQRWSLNFIHIFYLVIKIYKLSNLWN